MVKWFGGEIGIHAAFKPQSIWLWVRVPPGLQNTSKLGSETRPNSEVKKIKNILQSIWQIKSDYISL